MCNIDILDILDGFDGFIRIRALRRRADGPLAANAKPIVIGGWLEQKRWRLAGTKKVAAIRLSRLNLIKKKLKENKKKDFY